MRQATPEENPIHPEMLGEHLGCLLPQRIFGAPTVGRADNETPGTPEYGFGAVSKTFISKRVPQRKQYLGRAADGWAARSSDRSGANCCPSCPKRSRWIISYIRGKRQPDGGNNARVRQYHLYNRLWATGTLRRTPYPPCVLREVLRRVVSSAERVLS
jgi:hypothetical protein